MRVSRAGRYTLCIVDFRGTHRGERRGVRRHRPRFFIRFISPRIRPDGGLHSPYTPVGLYRFEAPLTCDPLGDAKDGSLTDPTKIAMELHVNWGQASAQQLKRALVDSERHNAHLLTCVDEALAQSEVCQPPDGARALWRRGPQLWPCSVRNCRRICFSWMTSSLCALWMSFPSTPS